MNNNHSYVNLSYKKRWISSILKAAISEHSIIVLIGARQVGKSTLLKNETPFKDWNYKNLDDYDTLYQAEQNPESLWTGEKRIVLDEVQKSKKLLPSVKLAIDSYCKECRFILSGSANILLMKSISESLAGRAVYFNLLPMTIGEITGKPPSNTLRKLFLGEVENLTYNENNIQIKDGFSLKHIIWKGFMPPLLRFTTDTAILEWWEGFITTYLERDLRQLSQIESLPDFRRLMGAIAIRCGKILNQTEVSRDTGIPQPTAHRYLNLLETSFMIERIPPYFVNRTKRLIKSPKLLFLDSGLASFLSGYFTPDSLFSSREAGGIFETVVFMHLKALSQLITPRPMIFHWRTVTGKEVDFVLSWGNKLIAVEAKLTEKPKYGDISNLRLFMEEYPETSAGILVHMGNEIKLMDKRIVAIPWWQL